jgi:hypothetical protein
VKTCLIRIVGIGLCAVLACPPGVADDDDDKHILSGLVSSTLVSLLLIPPLAVRWVRANEMTRQSVPYRGVHA